MEIAEQTKAAFDALARHRIDPLDTFVEVANDLSKSDAPPPITGTDGFGLLTEFRWSVNELVSKLRAMGISDIEIKGAVDRSYEAAHRKLLRPLRLTDSLSAQAKK